MFSQLGPLFKTMFRSAEAADARLEIRREEKESGRKNEGKEEEVFEGNVLWEDTTEVSVAALRTFLIDFLRHQSAPNNAGAEQAVLPNIISDINTAPEEPAPISTMAARAAKAYGAMAAQNAPAPTPPVITAAPTNTDANLADLLQSDEVRQIHKLITELDEISKNGIESLSIQLNGGTFLDGIQAAIQLARKTS